MKCAPSSPAKSTASSVRRSASARTPSSGDDEPALAEDRVEVQPAREAVDVVPVERVAHLVEVLGGELVRVVELVAVDQVAEPVDRAADALRRRLVAVLGLVAHRHEAGDHRPEGPDAKTRFHCAVQPPSTRMLVPLTSPALGEARKITAAATSVVVPTRPIGMRGEDVAQELRAVEPLGRPRRADERRRDGVDRHAVRPHSSASTFVSSSTPPFDAEYAAWRRHADVTGLRAHVHDPPEAGAAPCTGPRPGTRRRGP